MVALSAALLERGAASRLLLTVHDELVMEVCHSFAVQVIPGFMGVVE